MKRAKLRGILESDPSDSQWHLLGGSRERDGTFPWVGDMDPSWGCSPRKPRLTLENMTCLPSLHEDPSDFEELYWELVLYKLNADPHHLELG